MTEQVLVRDYGVCLPTGDSARGLLCAALAGIPAVTVVKEVALAVGDDTRAHHPCIAALPEDVDLEERLSVLLSGLVGEADQVLLAVPNEDNERHARILTYVEALPAALKPCLELVAEGALAGRLRDAVVSLRQGRQKNLALVGVDSLIHPAMLHAYAAEYQLRTDKAVDGRALGEGLAWFVLSSEEGDLRWEAEGSGHEPNYLCHGPVSMSGLADTLSGFSEGPPPRPALVIHGRAQTERDDLEWHHASQRLWPNRLPPRQTLAMRKGELDAPQPAPLPCLQRLKPAQIVGELGAASLPVAMALACERLRWDLQPAEHALVVDAQADGGRFAVSLSHHAVSSHSTQQGGCHE